MKIGGEKVETVSDFIFLGSKITLDCDCIHEIERYFLLGRKPVTNLHNILKSRDNILPTTVHIVKAIWSKLWFFQKSHMDVKAGP